MFCRNCGKDIGDSRFCPACGTKSEIDEIAIKTQELDNGNEDFQPKESEPQMKYGEYGEIIDENGRKTFTSAKTLIDTIGKSGGFYKVRMVFARISSIFYMAAFVMTILTMFSEVLSFLIPLSAALFVIAMIVSSPNIIMGIFVDKKNGEWLVNNNVNIDETIKRSINIRAEKPYVNSLLLSKLIHDKPSTLVGVIVFGIFNFFCVNFAIGLFDAFLVIVSIGINMSRMDIPFSIPYGQYLIGAVALIAFVIMIPTKIMQTILIKKAKKHFESAQKPSIEENVLG